MIRLRIREIAEAKGITMTDLSRMSDLDYRTVQAIFRNPYKKVTTLTLERMAKALGVAVAELMEEVADKG